MKTFKEILQDNKQYREIKTQLEAITAAYKQHQTEENLNKLTETFHAERDLYKNLWKDHQQQNGVFETITEYDYINVVNEKLVKDTEYKKNQYDRFKNKEFNFSHVKRVKDEYITDYDKIFIDSWSFHAVEPLEEKVSGYIAHVKESGKEFYIDKEKETLLILQ